MMINTAIYLRVSTEEQTKGYGLDAQRNQCKAMATVKGWQVVQTFADEGISGAKDEGKRAGLKALLASAEKGEIQAVIISALDRLGRDTRLILRLVDELNQHGCQIVSCKESIDTTTPTGQFILTVFAGLAQMERDTIASRLTGGRREREKRDGERGGWLPFGYERTYRLVEDERLFDGVVIHGTQAQTVRSIFSLRRAGETLRGIAKHLNMNQIKTQRGGKWYASSVRVILENRPIYEGGLRGTSQVSWPTILKNDSPNEMRVSSYSREQSRTVMVMIGKRYIVQPLDPHKLRHRGREVTVLGFLSTDPDKDKPNMIAKVQFTDDKQTSHIELDELLPVGDTD
ncbi:MAG: recombinase family protein [Candidatus Promineifilaceae bacterium]